MLVQYHWADSSAFGLIVPDQKKREAPSRTQQLKGNLQASELTNVETKGREGEPCVHVQGERQSCN